MCKNNHMHLINFLLLFSLLKARVKTLGDWAQSPDSRRPRRIIYPGPTECCYGLQRAPIRFGARIGAGLSLISLGRRSTLNDPPHRPIQIHSAESTRCRIQNKLKDRADKLPLMVKFDSLVFLECIL